MIIKNDYFQLEFYLIFFDERFEFFSDDNFCIAKRFIDESTYESKINVKIINIMMRLRKYSPIDFPKKCIEYYTGEDLCYVFNKSLRNFEKFYVEMAHFIGPFYYGIFRYTMEHPEKQLEIIEKYYIGI